VVRSDSVLTNSTPQANGPSASGTTPNSVYTGLAPTTPYFSDVRVTLDRLALKNVPKDLRIIPGMAVEADIKVGDRTLLQYFTERLLPIVTEGMREPN
jgi:HlyD family secretion protein